MLLTFFLYQWAGGVINNGNLIGYYYYRDGLNLD